MNAVKAIAALQLGCDRRIDRYDGIATSDVTPLDFTPAAPDATSKFLFAVQLMAVIDELGTVMARGHGRGRKHRKVVRNDDIRWPRKGGWQHEPALEGLGIDDVVRHDRPDARQPCPFTRDGTAQQGIGAPP